MAMNISSKTVLARELGVSRASLYYKRIQENKDWDLKTKIEEVLHSNPSYGYRRVSKELGMNRKPVQRVMKLFSIKPYRRRAKKYKKTKRIIEHFPNLLLFTKPRYPNHIWAGDFTYLRWQGVRYYLCTIIDLYTRKIVALTLLRNHSTELTLTTLNQALLHNGRPEIFHSDNGREYDAKIYKELLNALGTRISRSRPGCPWENGYQESFYDKFKVDIGDINRFKTKGELNTEIYKQIHYYNNTRIHSALNMAPVEFAKLYELSRINSINKA